MNYQVFGPGHVLLATTLFAASSILARVAYDDGGNPLAFVTVRAAAAVTILWVWLALSAEPWKLSIRDRNHAVILGLVVTVNHFALKLPMLRTRRGRIINIASIAGVMDNRGQTNYAAAKAGLIGATKSLSMECASRGVTVNAVAPGIIDSPMSGDAFPTERIKVLVPMQRPGRPDEVASLIAFLASDAESYISGQVIGINGGMA
ncbi:MAG: SDR family oxidoreductase [Betaproteobacteria bacterium]|nr:SDR family oxidoreductase [Betaproteobacteria bacterium]